MSKVSLRNSPLSQGKRATVFLPFVLPGETVEASVVERKPNLLRARAERIVSADTAGTRTGPP